MRADILSQLFLINRFGAQPYAQAPDRSHLGEKGDSG
jgi:hypothetical protein